MTSYFMKKVNGLTRILTLCAVGSGLGLGLSTSGCGMGNEVSKKPSITNPSSVFAVNEETEKLVERYEQDKNPEWMKKATRGYIKIGEYDKARECARIVLKDNYELGLILYEQIEREMPKGE